MTNENRLNDLDVLNIYRKIIIHSDDVLNQSAIKTIHLLICKLILNILIILIIIILFDNTYIYIIL